MNRPSTHRLRSLARTGRLTAAYAAASVLVATPLALASTGSSSAAVRSGDPAPTASPAPTDPGTSTAAPTATPEPAPVDPTTAAPSPTDPALTPSPTDPVVTPSPTGTSTAPPAPATAAADTLSGATAAVAASPLTVPHVVLATVPGAADTAAYLAPDEPLSGAGPFERVRVRFSVANTGTDPVDLVPLLEASTSGGTWLPVPAEEDPAAPLHLATEWVAVDGGTRPGPPEAGIAPAEFRAGTAAGGGAVDGRRWSAANPGTALALGPGQRTEVEFSVQVGRAPAPGGTDLLRLTDDGTALDGAAVAALVVAPEERVLSPGQVGGLTDPAATTPSSAVRYSLLWTPAPPTTTSTAAASTTTAAIADTGSVTANTPVPVLLSGAGHGSGTPSAGECTTCHSTHRAGGSALLSPAAQPQTCYVCHSGTGSATDVEAELALGQPANDPSTASYWSHDPQTGSSGHTLAADDELAGVANRHAVCSDCHNAHRARSDTPSSQVTDNGAAVGWSVPGALSGAPGVAVTNGPAGSAPTYTFLDGLLRTPTLEYQVCLTCHSGRTVLPSGLPGKPSTDSLDKGVELNPANASFHPVEAAGTNQTAAMAASLAGSSPYKQWSFATTDTVRCTSCHAGTPDPPADPGGTLSPHASTNRGILLRPYTDRALKPSGAAYSAADFALCLTCHAEEPYANAGGASSSTATSFPLHGMHLTGIAGMGSGGTDIDAPGAGQGNATCAECHFRLHGTTYQVPGEVTDGSRLVGFAPDVQPNAPGEQVVWTRDPAGGGSCTLTCHGQKHVGARY